MTWDAADITAFAAAESLWIDLNSFNPNPYEIALFDFWDK